MIFPRRFLSAAVAIFALVSTALDSRLAANLVGPVNAETVVDPASLPRTASLKIASGDTKLNALFYLAGGAGRHPVVVMFHGYPGNEKNLDLAQSLRRAGFHVVWFNYRGSWGSGGTFSLAHALEDARSVVAFVRSPTVAEKYGFDPERLAVVGHSFGGWLAFMLGAEDPKIGAVVGLAAWNTVMDVVTTEHDPKLKAEKLADLDFFDEASGPLRGNTAAGIYDEIAAHRRDYDYFRRAPALASRPLLIVAATRDPDQPLPTYHDPLVAALRAARAPALEALLLEDDHVFSVHRVALVEKVTQWLGAVLLRPVPPR